MYKCLLFLLFLSQFTVIAQSDFVSQRTYTKLDGLVLSNVLTMEMDTDGFLWVGGIDNEITALKHLDKKLVIQRFKGATFQSIILPDFLSKTILVSQIFKRNDGLFYIKVVNELGIVYCLFDPISCKFKEISSLTSKVDLQSSDIFKYQGKNFVLTQEEKIVNFCQLNDDLTVDKLFSFQKEGKKLYSIDNAELIFFENGILISDDNFSITFFDWQGKEIKSFTRNEIPLSDIEETHRTYVDQFYFENELCYLFLFKNPQLYRFDPTTIEFVIVENEQLESHNLYCDIDEKGKSIVATRKGRTLSLKLPKSNHLNTVFSNQNFNEGAISDVFSTNCEEDAWVSTNNQKMIHLDFPSNTVKKCLRNNSIRSIYVKDEKNVIVATDYEGWYNLNLETDNVSTFQMTWKNKEFIINTSRNIFKINDLYWTNNVSDIISLDSLGVIKSKSSIFPVICLEQQNDSILVFGTKKNFIYQYNINTHEHIELIPTDSLWVIDLKIKNQKLVAGTDNGILLYDFVSGESKLIQKSKAIPDDYILSVAEWKGQFLLGTKQGYIYSLDAISEEVKIVYSDKLKAGIASIICQDESNWWINTFNGFVSFDLKQNVTVRYSIENGFSNNEANRYSSMQLNDNYFVGTIDGLNYFNPKELTYQDDLSELVLLKVNLFSSTTEKYEDLLDRALFKDQETFVLPAENRTIQFDFGLKNSAHSNTYQFRYKLNDDAWRSIDKSQSITFDNLEAGEYIMEVEVLDFSGSKVGKSLFIKIDSEQFFYKTGLFYFIITVCLLMLFLAYLKILHKRRKIQEQYSHDLITQQEVERNRIARELHDSIGQQLTLIKKKSQSEGMDEISKLTSTTLDEMRAISRDLYPPLLEQIGLTQSIKDLVDQFDEAFSLFFTVEVQNIDGVFVKTEELSIYRYIQEAVSNIIKHANAKAVTLEVIHKGNNVTIVIEDNGVGFEVNEKRNSLGLKTMRERIKFLKGHFSIESEPNKGTIIKAEINLK